MSRCVADLASAPRLTRAVSGAQRSLGWATLGDLATGEGVTVAVIDTGVNPHPLLGDRLVAGGDDLDPGARQPGLADCDGHGTLVAGILAAAPDMLTGFSGVAPGARVISMRQSTTAYVRVTTKGRVPVGDEATLAAAIRRAVKTGADVINISTVNCTNDISDTEPALVAAVSEALAQDVLVVASAGNVGDAAGCTDQNVEGAAARTIASPASIEGVLTVGSVAPDGTPSDFSLAGEWVDVAAPGEALISISPQPARPGQVDEVVTGEGRVPIAGTSFSAPMVSGLAALVRSRFPGLSARQVAARITATASPPSGAGARSLAVGHGIVNPRLALTAVLPIEGSAGTPVNPQPAMTSRADSMPALPAQPDRSTARLVSLVGSGSLLALLAGGLGWRAMRRRSRP